MSLAPYERIATVLQGQGGNTTGQRPAEAYRGAEAPKSFTKKFLAPFLLLVKRRFAGLRPTGVELLMSCFTVLLPRRVRCYLASTRACPFLDHNLLQPGLAPLPLFCGGEAPA